MNKRFWLNSAVTLLAGLAIGTAQATKLPLKTFEELDANGDGSISRDEAKAAPSLGDVDHFAKFDKNKDGKIDKTEYDAYAAKERPKTTPTQ